MFCPECGSILKPEEVDGEKVMSCDCGYSEESSDTQITEKAKEEKEIEVVDEDQSDESLPIVEEECPECGNDEARYWTKQMRSGDEPATQFYKCTECKHTWREG